MAGLDLVGHQQTAGRADGAQGLQRVLRGRAQDPVAGERGVDEHGRQGRSSTLHCGDRRPDLGPVPSGPSGLVPPIPAAVPVRARNQGHVRGRVPPRPLLR